MLGLKKEKLCMKYQSITNGSLLNDLDANFWEFNEICVAPFDFGSCGNSFLVMVIWSESFFPPGHKVSLVEHFSVCYVSELTCDSGCTFYG